MARRRTILFAIPALDRGGPDRVIYELLCGLDRSRYQPALLVSEPVGHYLTALPSDVEVTILGEQRTWRDRHPIARTVRTVHELAPDVIMSTLRMNLTLGLAQLALPPQSRLILRQANDFSADFSRLIKGSLVKHRVARALLVNALRSADAIVCQSEGMKADIGRALGAPARRTPPRYAISNPIDVANAQRAARAKSLAPWGAPALVAAGRLMPQKGFDILLPAIAAVLPEFPGLHLRILGDGPDAAALRAQAAALGVAHAVTFAGFSSEVLPTVAAADAFVLASRYEGFPNAALEALAVGTPVVLTDCPGANHEIVQPGVNGRLASAVTPAAMAEALRRALRERAQYDRTRIAADTDRRYGAATILAQYQAVFDEVMAAPPRLRRSALAQLPGAMLARVLHRPQEQQL